MLNTVLSLYLAMSSVGILNGTERTVLVEKHLGLDEELLITSEKIDKCDFSRWCDSAGHTLPDADKLLSVIRCRARVHHSGQHSGSDRSWTQYICEWPDLAVDGNRPVDRSWKVIDATVERDYLYFIERYDGATKLKVLKSDGPLGVAEGAASYVLSSDYVPKERFESSGFSKTSLFGELRIEMHNANGVSSLMLGPVWVDDKPTWRTVPDSFRRFTGSWPSEPFVKAVDENSSIVVIRCPEDPKSVPLERFNVATEMAGGNCPASSAEIVKVAVKDVKDVNGASERVLWQQEWFYFDYVSGGNEPLQVLDAAFTKGLLFLVLRAHGDVKAVVVRTGNNIADAKILSTTVLARWQPDGDFNSASLITRVDGTLTGVKLNGKSAENQMVFAEYKLQWSGETPSFSRR